MANRADVRSSFHLNRGRQFPNYPQSAEDPTDEAHSQPISKEIYDEFKKCHELAAEAANIKAEAAYARQQVDLLQQEKDLLKWHSASRTKALRVKDGEIQHYRTECQILRPKLEAIRNEVKFLQNEKSVINCEINSLGEDVEILRKDKEGSHSEFLEWLARRNDFVSETTAERRMAEDERRKRNGNYKDLNVAIKRDKIAQRKLERWRQMENVAVSTFESISFRLEDEIKKSSDAQLNAKLAFVADPEEVPFTEGLSIG